LEGAIYGTAGGIFTMVLLIAQVVSISVLVEDGKMVNGNHGTIVEHHQVGGKKNESSVDFPHQPIHCFGARRYEKSRCSMSIYDIFFGMGTVVEHGDLRVYLKIDQHGGYPCLMLFQIASS
jgi:hypothetical protein